MCFDGNSFIRKCFCFSLHAPQFRLRLEKALEIYSLSSFIHRPGSHSFCYKNISRSISITRRQRIDFEDNPSLHSNRTLHTKRKRQTRIIQTIYKHMRCWSSLSRNIFWNRLLTNEIIIFGSGLLFFRVRVFLGKVVTLWTFDFYGNHMWKRSHLWWRQKRCYEWSSRTVLPFLLTLIEMILQSSCFKLLRNSLKRGESSFSLLTFQ